MIDLREEPVIDLAAHASVASIFESASVFDVQQSCVGFELVERAIPTCSSFGGRGSMADKALPTRPACRPTDSGSREAASTAAEFGEIFRSIAASTVVREIWLSAFADEYPDQASPFSFVTRTELNTLVTAFSAAHSRRLVDLGCGCGGPGLFVASHADASLDGIDTSAVAVELATAAAIQDNMSSRARFHVADASTTGLRSARYTGVMSIDALQIMPSPTAVITEAARLLQPGGVFAFTTWSLSAPWRNRAVVPDYRPLLEEHGFDILSYAEPSGWRERQLCVYRLTQERSAELEAEIGASVANLLVAHAVAAPEALANGRRVVAVACLPATSDGARTRNAGSTP